jgi:hypothetical protein
VREDEIDKDEYSPCDFEFNGIDYHDVYISEIESERLNDSDIAIDIEYDPAVLAMARLN